MTSVPAVTGQAIAKIKGPIMSGEFTAGPKLPKEQDLAQRVGLSRSSLHEAVRAPTLIGVLEPRVVTAPTSRVSRPARRADRP